MERELATILAALRYWQRRAIEGPTQLHCLPEYDIASNGDECEVLGTEEIDELCENLNFQNIIIHKVWAGPTTE